MDGGTADLNSDDGIECANGSLKWLKVSVLVWEDTVLTSIDAKTHAPLNNLFRGLEPCISLRL